LFEGWWYEGAGIYRHVWLVKTNPLHIAPNGTFVTTKLNKTSAGVTIRTRVVNNSDARITLQLKASLHAGVERSEERAKRRTGSSMKTFALAPWSQRDIVQKIHIPNRASGPATTRIFITCDRS
jgi:beta-galactosidase